jgi:hypothetical protein
MSAVAGTNKQHHHILASILTRRQQAFTLTDPQLLKEHQTPIGQASKHQIIRQSSSAGQQTNMIATLSK